MTLLSTLEAFCKALGIERNYWIAYSGGLDSHVLLSLCAELKKKIPIKFHAIHIHHGLSPHAKEWATHCEKICKDKAIPYVKHHITVALQRGESLEETARNLRYDALAHYLNEHDVLLTAHHQDDQAETLLLQLFRGAGPKGLAAMPLQKLFAKGVHGRPLLSFSRRDLHEYAKQHQLKWIEDETNCNTQLMRNFIRHEIFPLLKLRLPTLSETLSRSAMHCGEAQYLLEAFAQSALKEVEGSNQHTLSVKKLLQLNPAKCRLILRTWIKERGHSLPDKKKLATIESDVLHASWDRLPKITWKQTVLRRYRDDLYLMEKVSPKEAVSSFTWNLSHPFFLPGIGTLQADLTQGQGISREIQSVLVRFREKGERLFIPGRGMRSLKKLFQEWEVLPWLRTSIPLIFYENKLVAVPGYFFNKEFAVKKEEMGRLLSLIE